MQPYANLGGNSNVESYFIGTDWIEVRFKGKSPNHYTYTYASAGQANVEQMKKLALAGQGLNSFIGRVVRKGYASKY